MTGKDKDYRYMATSDLLNELNKEGFKADTDLEIKLSNIVLQQLDDVAGDVSGLAVKWYVSLSLSLSLIAINIMTFVYLVLAKSIQNFPGMFPRNLGEI
jgi:cullin-associated NEDD8-dissociated protein 1